MTLRRIGVGIGLTKFSMMTSGWRLALTALCFGMSVGTPAMAEEKTAKGKPARHIAWIIANTDYLRLPKLQTPLNDARAMAEKLRKSGFAVVLETYDAGQKEMGEALEKFRKTIKPADVVVVTYSGASFEIGKKLFIAPVDMTVPKNLKNLALNPTPVGDILQAMDTSKNLRLMLFDGPRHSPLYEPIAGASGESNRECQDISPGRVVFYSTKRGATALDVPPADRKAKHSPFANAVLKSFSLDDLHGFYAEVFKSVAAVSYMRQLPVMCGLEDLSAAHLVRKGR